MTHEASKAPQPLSGHDLLARLAEHHNVSAAAYRSEAEEHALFKAENPELADAAQSIFRDGEIDGKREALTGVRLLIEKVLSESDSNL